MEFVRHRLLDFHSLSSDLSISHLLPSHIALSLSSWIWNPISRSRPFFIFSNLPSHSLPFYLFSFLFTLSLTFTSNCRPTYFWKFFLLSSFCNNNQILKKIIKFTNNLFNNHSYGNFRKILTLISYFVQNSQVTLDHFVQKLHIILLT